MKATLYIIVFLTISITEYSLAQEVINQNSKHSNLERLIPTAVQQIAAGYTIKGFLSTINNKVNIQQVGNQNYAYINQSLGNGSDGNLASIIQSNNGNYASITQSGNGNNNKIVQTGGGNNAIINISGDNNTSSVVQDGNNNYSLQNINASNKTYDILQQGNNNSFQRYDNGQSPKAYIISQKGNGLHLIISHNSYVK